MKNIYGMKHIFDSNGYILPEKNRTFITKEGYQCTLIDAGSKINYVTARIEDWVTEVQMSHIKRGILRYPMHPSVYNTGFTGIGEFTSKSHGKAYKVWQSMLERGYSDKWHEKYPTYKNVSVHISWHNFQTFAKWFIDSNYKEGWQLDKDLMVKGNKVYSEDTCIFIPARLNTFLANTHSTNTSGHAGVRYVEHRNKWTATIHIEGKNKYLGYFTQKEDAIEAYATARSTESEKLKEQYSSVLSAEAIENII